MKASLRLAVLTALLLTSACTTLPAGDTGFHGPNGDPYPYQNRQFRGQPNP